MPSDIVLLRIVALYVKQMLYWTGHRCYDIGEEEMAESDFAKRLDDDMPKCFGKLYPTSQVEEVEWH